MKLLKTKTTRFADVVQDAGRPEIYTLWQKPADDRHFHGLIKNHRVMTVTQTDSGTDFGIAGFKEQKGSRYLVFPKSLKRFENHRIVGLKWDLVKS